LQIGQNANEPKYKCNIMQMRQNGNMANANGIWWKQDKMKMRNTNLKNCVQNSICYISSMFHLHFVTIAICVYVYRYWYLVIEISRPKNYFEWSSHPETGHNVTLNAQKYLREDFLIHAIMLLWVYVGSSNQCNWFC